MKKNLVVYLTAGYPSAGMFLKAAEVAWDEGVDLLEVGLPFSDPIADGPVIQAASQRAIRSGVDFDRTMSLARRLPPHLARVLMTYSNPLFVRGWPLAFSEISRAGFSGCVLPDVPVEELLPLISFLPENFYLTPFAAPTTTGDRLNLYATAARGGAFIYLVSLRGITGAALGGAAQSAELERLISGLRRVTHAPIYVGFGVQTGRDAARLAAHADGVIVGTAALRALALGIKPFARLLRELRTALF
ncbi:tryptophan synthase subunit alpha [bacterium]|nr:tryptophan synthase subunit alpha [bacterium]